MKKAIIFGLILLLVVSVLPACAAPSATPKTKPCPVCNYPGATKPGLCTTCGGDHQVNCPTCQGTTQVCASCNGTTKVACDKCGGRGVVKERFKCPDCYEGWIHYPEEGVMRECPRCKGTGTVEIEGPCDKCDGNGTVQCTTCDGKGIPLPGAPAEDKKRCPNPDCKGSGQVPCQDCLKDRYGKPTGLCRECEGDGQVPIEDP